MTRAGIAAVILGLVALTGLQGCGRSLDSALQGALDGVTMTWRLGYIPITDACKAEAEACRDQGIHEPKKCVAWVRCDRIRHAFAAAHVAAAKAINAMHDAAQAARKAGYWKEAK